MSFDLDSFPLWTAVVTPFDGNGRVDLTSFEHLLKRQESAGNGVVLLGSTGEALAMDFEEQCSVVEFACSLKLGIPLLVGVGGFQLPKVLQWLDFCEGQNIHGHLMPTPLYAKPGPQGQRQWFEALLGRVKRPCMLYNVPSRTGQVLLPEAIIPLIDHPNFWALKEASGSVETFGQYHLQLPGIAMLSGDDAMTYSFVSVGGQGLVSVAANIWPSQMRWFVDRCLAQDLPRDQRNSIEQACEALFIASNPIPTKVLLHHKKEIATPTLRPPLTHQELAGLDALLEADRVLSCL